ncbi:MAG: bifunctional [glutamine synthetase] adenylyltransferase/[glutamine synthetase]-adenylyl-L-tyrosine phosphorylase, partial [Parvibaculaceae bacterium]
AAEADVRAALRQERAKAALLIAIADIGGAWSLEQVTAALTRFADASLDLALDWLLAEAHRAGRTKLPDPANPSRGSGYVVLAMGKHGAFELNYSSDIDLIVFFDADADVLSSGVEPATFYVRLTKRLAGLLQDVTEDGYAFRVDLRLRPDPRATQVAIALEAAAIYYENMGQNWERAAMIKARPAAGDLALGEEFIERLKPYVWRKYLDYAAIADIQSLTRQIRQVKGHGAVAVHGHNIKLGSGGIRAIEFFVQTQQLIAGGRNPKLRGRRTLDMLDALAEATWITREVADEMQAAYRFLRMVEHRIQMVSDEQTHTLPEEGEAFDRLAHFSGFASADAFATEIRATLETVRRHSEALFEGSAELAADQGSLVFTGGEDDPETIETLRGMGFARPSDVSATIRGWHFGRYAATRSAKSKELLTELMPALLKALGRSGDPDEAFVAFDRFLAGLPAGIQLFSLLRANPGLLSRIATILGTAPRLAEGLSDRPKVLAAMIEPDARVTVPSRLEMADAVASAMPDDLAYEEALDQARVFGKEQMFRIGVQVMDEALNATEAGIAYSRLAARLIARLLTFVEREMAEKYGRIGGGRAAVLAMGKLGGREMTAASDLDLVLIYDHAPGVEQSDGRRPLPVSRYYTRLTQRLIAALSAPTSEGVLYEVDMRLRPSGNQGPVATHIETFRSYHSGSAWTWEKLALTRARAVAGPQPFQDEVERTVRQALSAPSEKARVRADIVDMRRRLLAEFGRGGPWNIKHVSGGLVDVEFVAQGLQILNAAQRPEVLDQNTLLSLEKLADAGCLSHPRAERLKAAGDLYLRLIQIIRLCVGKEFYAESAPRDLGRLIARAAGTPDMAAAESLLADTEAEVAGLFADLIGPL